MKNRNRKWRWKRKSFVIAGKSSLCLFFPFLPVLWGRKQRKRDSEDGRSQRPTITSEYERFPGPSGPVFHRLGFLLSETQDRDQMGLRRFLFASCPIFSVPILYFLSLPFPKGKGRERKMGTEKGQMLLKRKRRRRESLAGGLGRKEQKQQELTPAFCTWSLGGSPCFLSSQTPQPPRDFPMFPVLYSSLLLHPHTSLHLRWWV